jgi:pimeloyl-ACP methyl ester carboxylesterase
MSRSTQADADPQSLSPRVEFPIGFHRFVRNRFISYQLNRWHALGYARRADVEQAAARINSFADCVREFEAVAEAAVAEHRLDNAAVYYRAAEFFEPAASARKLELYDKAIASFDAAFTGDGIQRHLVPYGDGHLSALRMAPQGEPRNETLLVCGGFDSLIEEFYGIWGWFARQGYDVIAFEGPGQGGTLRTHGLVFDHDWEKPTTAVLDHFQIESAALLGISMGGYWALRAAAFEPRITRLIANPPLYDWLETTNALMRWVVRLIMRWRWFINVTVRMKMALAPVIRHAMDNAKFISGRGDSFGACSWLLEMRKEHLHSERVACDVLLLGGEHDAFQPIKLLRKQEAALVNAKSITTRVFTKAEQADQHCQMGNLQLSLDVMTQWLETGQVQ